MDYSNSKVKDVKIINAYFYNITVQGYLVKIINNRLSRLDAFVDKSTINGKTKARQIADAQFAVDHPDLNISDYTITVGNPITVDNFNIISVTYFAGGDVHVYDVDCSGWYAIEENVD